MTDDCSGHMSECATKWEKIVFITMTASQITTLCSTLNATLTGSFDRANSVSQPQKFSTPSHPPQKPKTLDRTACFIPTFSNSSPSPISPPFIPITPSLPARGKCRSTYGKDLTPYSPAWISTAPTNPPSLPFPRQSRSRC